MNKKLMRAGLIMVLLVLLAALAVPALAQGRPPANDKGALQSDPVYIVMMAQDPVVAYEGGIRGYPATRPNRGERINPNSSNVTKYANFLRGRHTDAMRAVGLDPSTDRVYDYVYSFNGFAAAMTRGQAATLLARPDVLMVWADELRQPTTENSPDFLGLTDANGGLWADLGLDGEDLIIGVIDTGAWPEHPSFSDQADLADRPGSSGKDQRVYDAPPSYWHGTCQAGELWSKDDCNNKLIGARYFLSGFTRHGVLTDEYASARDRDGHGTHTASTAAGNAGVPASIFGIDRGEVSGMAPRARIAVYKALWNDEGGFTSDLAAAIDAAVADGVDVINYSIGSSSTFILGADDIAFLFAANAGVFVANSAGNDGPDAETIGSPSGDPWITTVAASTQDRTFQGSVELGDGSEYFGASVTTGVGPLPLVDAADAGSELCIVGELDPAVVSGAIVLCKRGENARVDKSLAVYLAGGLGMVLYNDTEVGTVTDNHWVPSVHVENGDGLAIKAYIDANGASATATIHGGVATPVPGSWMADFSSRGPNGASYDILKPDVTAPGVNILAGNTPNPFAGSPGQYFQSISGTSMSSPHVAGLALLILESHPTWTPAMVRSAFMTTARQDVMKEDGVTPADPFDFGAGHVVPNSAVDPGLVYNAALRDYLAFFCGYDRSVFANPTGTCNALAGLGYSFDASDLNLASIAIGQLAGVQTVKRTVTNVGAPGNYTAIVEAPPGVDVSVNPAVLSLNTGQSASFQVTFTSNADAVFDAWTFGALTWSDGTHDVRSPLVVMPAAVAAPDEIHGTGATGSATYEITPGYTGDFTTSVYGLVIADTVTATVVDDPANDIDTALATGVGVNFHYYELTGVAYQRFRLFNDFVDGAIDDLDLYVYFCSAYEAGHEGDHLFCTTWDEVGSSGGGESEEEVNLENPADGDYRVAVHGWGTDGPDAIYTLFSFTVTPVDAGNLTVTAPATVTVGVNETIQLDWAGLTPGKWLGLVVYGNGVDILGHTIVSVDVP